MSSNRSFLRQLNATSCCLRRLSSRKSDYATSRSGGVCLSSTGQSNVSSICCTMLLPNRLFKLYLKSWHDFVNAFSMSYSSIFLNGFLDNMRFNSKKTLLIVFQLNGNSESVRFRQVSESQFIDSRLNSLEPSRDRPHLTKIFWSIVLLFINSNINFVVRCSILSSFVFRKDRIVDLIGLDRSSDSSFQLSNQKPRILYSVRTSMPKCILKLYSSPSNASLILIFSSFFLNNFLQQLSMSVGNVSKQLSYLKVLLKVLGRLTGLFSCSSSLELIVTPKIASHRNSRISPTTRKVVEYSSNR